MFRTSKQLKDNIANLSRSTGISHIVLQRRYMLDRFLERISRSKYRDAFILKGGMLISDMVGVASRATQDLDTTVKGLPLTPDYMKKIVEEIAGTDIGDAVSFTVTSTTKIMEGAEYEGIRFGLSAAIQNMVVPIKIDISTGDVITPEEVGIDYKLMFEDRYIHILAYPLDTVLAEKIESMLTRADANTRMRDFYDMHILFQTYRPEINGKTLAAALSATAQKRKSLGNLDHAEDTLALLESSETMKAMWKQYQKTTSYAASFSWQDVMWSVRRLCSECDLQVKKASIRYELNNIKREQQTESDCPRHKKHYSQER